jgi:hypothetical protein
MLKNCWIKISCYLDEHTMVGTLLHEMVHQYQLQVLKMAPDHGPIFRTMCKWIERETKFQLRK